MPSRHALSLLLPEKPNRTLLRFIDHQFAARGVALFRYLVECDDDSFSAGAGFFDQSVGDPLRDLPFLIDGAALQHRDLNHRHRNTSCQHPSAVKAQSPEPAGFYP